MKKLPFYVLNLTWGLPVNIAGGIAALGAMATGHKPQKYGDCILFEMGKKPVGHNMGLFIFVGSDSGDTLRAHEHGHSIQNCKFGPLMPFIIDLPSSSRFWYRQAVEKLNPKKKLPPYDSVWFERRATELGTEHMKQIRKRNGSGEKAK